ncbi:MAG: hypothetical protein FWD15_01400 [Alphaproteobacteria bacterium]|nr:hypothetical protein [Alphaproteobacteria bacterium]
MIMKSEFNAYDRCVEKGWTWEFGDGAQRRGSCKEVRSTGRPKGKVVVQ